MIAQLHRLIPLLGRLTTQLAALGVAVLIYSVSMFAAIYAVVILGIHSDIAAYLFIAFFVGGPIVGLVVGWRIWRLGNPPVPKEPVPPGWGQKRDEG